VHFRTIVPKVSTALSAVELTKTFGDFTAVDGISFSVPTGETFAILGPNGAGKSSTMKMVTTVSPASSGTLTILGMDPNVDGRSIRARLGVVPQEDILDSEMTVRENLVMYSRYFGLSWADGRTKADELLKFVQLNERANDRVEPLSGGMKRRLTIARALVNDPSLVLLDEPTTGLDPQARHLLWDRLYQLKEQGVSLLLTTHYMDEAEQLADRLIVMDNGKISAEGAPSELIATYCPREVLELRFDDRTSPDLERVTNESGLRTEKLPDRMLVYADDGEAALSHLVSRDIHPTGTLIRRATLEDVFLALTGRSLNE
jgi:lipooligosaccharide transport system ATP-binding protein